MARSGRTPGGVVSAARAGRGGGPQDVVGAFFSELAERGFEPLLHMAHGTIAFALREDDRAHHWRVAIAHGDVRVARGRARADCAVDAPRELFVRLLTGDAHPWTAYLREEYAVSGDIGLLVAFERLLPSAKLAGEAQRTRSPKEAKRR